MNKKHMVFELGELFCGPGGLAFGASQAKIETKDSSYSISHKWANDYDEDTCATYRRNICPDRPETVICGDVRKIDLLSLPKIDAFAYGFPCNDFSLVGKQKGFDGEFGPLYTYGLTILNHSKPKFFIAENVGGIASANNGLAFKKILNDLQEAGRGYNLTAHLYKCEEYGVPQFRHRIVMVGIDKTLDLKYKVPAPTTMQKYISAREAIENPPISSDAPNNDKTTQSAVVVERLKHTKPGQNAWTANLPDHLKLNVKGAKLSQIYRRLHPDRPSYTLTGSGGGGTHGYHWSEPRALTNRERARIQSFPDNFIFEGSKESVRRQIGMVVPPKMSSEIFRAILKTFAGINYPSVSANINIEMDLFKEELLQKVAV